MSNSSVLDVLKQFRFAKKSVHNPVKKEQDSALHKNGPASSSMSSDKSSGNSKSPSDSKTTLTKTEGKFSVGVASDNESPSSSKGGNLACFKRRLSDDNSNETAVPKKSYKRLRLTSDSESENSASDSPHTNGNADDNSVDADTLEENLTFVSKTFPSCDRMEIQDLLIQGNSVETVVSMLTEKKKKKKKKQGRQKIDAADEENDYEMDSDKIYDSDDSIESDEEMTTDRKLVSDFFNEATLLELAAIPRCSKKKAESIIQMRPFTDWADMVTKFRDGKFVTTDMLNGAKELLHLREVVQQLMRKCEKISTDITTSVNDLLNGHAVNKLTQQPSLLNSEMKLSAYQMIGLNWLRLMHEQKINGVLADEMGLGKTIQAIAFLAYLKERNEDFPNLIVVPTSTFENWTRELDLWCPSLRVLPYIGAQAERQKMRIGIFYKTIDEFDVLITTYNIMSSTAVDRGIFKKVQFNYVVFDEAHMLKNMMTQRFEFLMKVKATRRLLLTGTPMQNNLVELMSLLVFVMPDLFVKRKEHLKKVFSMIPRTDQKVSKTMYEMERINHAKKIMKPFFLRRLKSDVLKDLPKKHEKILQCAMTPSQHEKYEQMITLYKNEDKQNKGDMAGATMMMNLRKLSCHPLLLRYHYDDKKLKALTKLVLKERDYQAAVYSCVFEDFSVMSDFEIHTFCKKYKSLSNHMLSSNQICESGKLNKLDEILPVMQRSGDRVLLFSQFVMVLDIVEEYMKIRQYKYLRLDGSTPFDLRQELIDTYNSDTSVFVFLLSTRAGGLGINLTAANAVVLHDIDFNPHNDKQAEDRCHRMGQKKEVNILRLISTDTIEEGMLQIAEEKLKLEKNLSDKTCDEDDANKKDVGRLLKLALGISKDV